VTSAQSRNSLVKQLAEAAAEMKALDLVALDVHALTSFADAFLIATGTSDRHVRSVADAVLEASEGTGRHPLGVEGYDEGRWVLIDLNEVVVHIFQEEVREYYDLERLWSDAPAIEVGEPGERVSERGKSHPRS
jgi:ribosome-associated protein